MFKKNLIFTFLKIFLISKKWMWLSFFNKLFSFPFLSILCWLVPLFSVNIFSCLSLATADMFFPHPWYIFLYAATIFSHLCFCFSYCLSQVTLFLLKVCLHCVCFFFFWAFQFWNKGVKLKCWECWFLHPELRFLLVSEGRVHLKLTEEGSIGEMRQGSDFED